MSLRWDETWHRLREWTNGQAPSERLAAQILLSQGYTDLDPSHPLGGKDGLKDAICFKGRKKWVMAVYFPRGQQPLKDIKDKLIHDLQGVAAANADGLVFVTNQELRLSDRKAIKALAGKTPIRLFHLERITAILDQPLMSAVRKQFLGIDFDPTVRAALQVLCAPGRTEAEIREAIIGLAAAQKEMLSRNVESGESRCTACGSTDIRYSVTHFDRGSLEWWFCGECGEHLGDCV